MRKSCRRRTVNAVTKVPIRREEAPPHRWLGVARYVSPRGCRPSSELIDEALDQVFQSTCARGGVALCSFPLARRCGSKSWTITYSVEGDVDTTVYFPGRFNRNVSSHSRNKRVHLGCWLTRISWRDSGAGCLCLRANFGSGRPSFYRRGDRRAMS